MNVLVRRAASAAEIEAAGEITAEAYRADRLVTADDAYLVELTDAHRRAREAVLLVALVPRDLQDPHAEPDVVAWLEVLICRLPSSAPTTAGCGRG